MTNPKKGILIAFGELFLKSEGVKVVFRKRLVQNLSFSFEKKGLDFKINTSRERIFIETSEVKKALKIIKNVFGVAWLTDCFFFPKANLKEVLSFIKENHE
jgi:adenylyl- and sulfurtransferase ThiI